MSRDRELVDYCINLKFEILGDWLIEHTKLVILDTLGAIIGGFQNNPRYKKWAEEIMSATAGKSTILGIGNNIEEGYAALANGTAGPSLELDEGNKFCAGHPSIHVIPAALSLSERERRNGKEFITAIVAGYEIASRIGRAITPLKMEFHPHGTWGVVGAAIACARLLRFNTRQAYQTASIASSYSLNTFFDTALEGATVRDTCCGVANFLGILAVHLSQHGFTGLNQGIIRQYAHLGENGFQESCLVDSLGERFEIATNYFKIHVGCRSTHGALDAINQIISSHGPIAPKNIVKIEVSTYASAARLCNPNPNNALQARFSLPYALAARLYYGSGGIDSFKTESITEEVIKLARKVTVSENPRFSSTVPHKRPTQVVLYLLDGRKESALVEIPEGDGDRPFSPKTIEEKFFTLASPRLGTSKVEKILASIDSLEAIEDIRSLTSLLI